MQKSKEKDEISPQLTKPARRSVQSKLFFGKDAVDKVEKEKEEEITVEKSQLVEKDISSSQSNISCVKPLVDHQDAKLIFLDEEKYKRGEIEGEEKKRKAIKICQPKLPWHKPPIEEAKTIVAEEGGRPEESSGKRRKYQKRTPQKSPLKKNKEERRSSARIKSNNNSNGQQLENKQKTGEDHPEMHPDNGDTELGGSSSKKTQKRTPKKTPKEKKNDTTKGVCSPNMNVCYQVTDLRLEAKLAAEENSRLFAGKQTHPFFTSRKLAKRAPEINTIKTETKCWPGLDGDYTVSCPPIHVIDSPEDGVASLDWKNWVFKDTSYFKPNGYPRIENALPVLDGIIKPLNMDDLPRKTMHLNKEINEEYVQQSFMDLEKLTSVSEKLLFDSLKNKQPDTERLTSYYQRISCWPECSLWTNKYQPENALEVCGNSESVQFICEWLKSWDEKSLQSSRMKHVWVDSDDSAYENESDMDDEVNLKNVLLIKGPVGSGKSAAIYACAKEQGYEVIEVNTSDLRNGAHMKQVFGQAMDSHALNKWSVEGPTVSKRKLIFNLFTNQTVIGEDDDLGSGSLETSSSSCKQDLANEDKLSWDALEKNSACHTANKSLILFEDVDTVFDEDRGFLSSILHLAETAKRPIILTSNCKNPVLPSLLDYTVLDFVLPSKEELHSHLSMICASEKVNISSDLLEHLVRCCVGDIRKTLMLLQFWCQGKRFQIDKTFKSSYNSLAFDIDAAYLITPRMISWELQCMLSEKVADEIDRAIAKIKEKKIEKMEAMLEEFSAMQMIKNRSRKRKDLKTPVKAKKKKALVKTNSSFPDSTELLNQANDLEDIYDSFDSPKPCAHKPAMRRTGIVISSQSEDLSDGEHPCISQNRDILPFDLNISYHGEMHDTASQPLENFETASVSHICDTHLSQDVSCVPESCFMDGFLDISSQNTSVNLAGPILSPEKNNSIKPDIDLNKCLEDNFENTFDRDVEQVNVNGNEEVEENSQNEIYISSCPSQYMDECSRADFNIKLMPSTADKISDEVDLVEETWKKLRVGHHDLKSYVAANSKTASLVLKHVSGLADLMCETDIMFKSCYCLNNDILEPSMIPCFEPDVRSFYEQQMEMGSIYAQHGLCYHTSNIAELGCNLGHKITKDLPCEMLNSSMNTMALGKLISKGNTSLESCTEGNKSATKSICRVPTKRKLEAELYSAMLTTVPGRLSMVLRNSAFHEYVSFYSKISKLECVRLSQSVVEKRRRSRGSQHYLSSGSFSMSDEHVQLLAKCNCFNQKIEEIDQKIDKL